MNVEVLWISIMFINKILFLSNIPFRKILTKMQIFHPMGVQNSEVRFINTDAKRSK